MGHYNHVQYTFVFKDLPEKFIEMLDIQERWLYHDRYFKQSEEKTKERYLKVRARSDKFEKEHVDCDIGKFIRKYPHRWDSFALYEVQSWEFAAQGIETPWGFDASGLHAWHGQFDIRYGRRGAFTEFIEMVKPYIKSGSAWDWWESDMSAFQVIY